MLGSVVDEVWLKSQWDNAAGMNFPTQLGENLSFASQ